MTSLPAHVQVVGLPQQWFAAVAAAAQVGGDGKEEEEEVHLARVGKGGCRSEREGDWEGNCSA